MHGGKRQQYRVADLCSGDKDSRHGFIKHSQGSRPQMACQSGRQLAMRPYIAWQSE